MADGYRIDREKLRMTLDALRSMPPSDEAWREELREEARTIESLVFGAEWGSHDARITKEVLRLCELVQGRAPNPCPPFSCLNCGEDGRIIHREDTGRAK
ncbi:MAG: hypothetical protein AB1625_14835 [Acidobacteriota bacterium]